MGLCEKVKIDRVICDEIFYLRNLRQVSNQTLPARTVDGVGANIIGSATVALKRCNFRQTGDTLFADLEFGVQEELRVTGNNFNPVPLEYSYAFTETVQFRKCTLPAGVTVDDLQCHVVRLNADVSIPYEDFDLTGRPTVSFDNVVDIELKLKVLQEVQTFIPICDYPMVVTDVGV